MSQTTQAETLRIAVEVAIRMKLKSERPTMDALHDILLEAIPDNKNITGGAIFALIDEMPYGVLLEIEMWGASDTEVRERIGTQLREHGLPPSVSSALTDKKV